MNYKQIPEDFKVEEIIKLKTSASGDYTYFWLTKKNWTTLRAIREVARKCNVSFKRFKFAGTKDSNAITKQAISAFKISPETLANIKLKDINIEIIGLGEKQISLGDLTGNKFEIIVRNLSKKFSPLGLKATKQFPNYFGEQRFGGGNTALIGKEIVLGRLDEAAKYMLTYSEIKNAEAKKARAFAKKNWGKWPEILAQFPIFLGLEKAVLNQLVTNPTDYGGALRKLPKPVRKMYVHAYQSLIFNKALEQWCKTNKKVVLLEVPGFNTKLGRDKFSKLLWEILNKENISLDVFKCARMPELASAGVKRSSFVVVKKFKSGPIEDDELNLGKKKISLQFELPKGAYATVLLKVLFDG